MEVTLKLIKLLLSYNQRNKLTNWVTIFWNFTYNIHCFCCAMLLDQQIAKYVLLSVFGNPLRIKINLSQTMTLSIKREEVLWCAHTFCFNRNILIFLRYFHITNIYVIKRTYLKGHLISVPVFNHLVNFCLLGCFLSFLYP